MEKNVRTRFIQKFIISIICCVTLLNFGLSSTVKAADFGGELMYHMLRFTEGLADVVAQVVQLGLTGHWHSAVDEPGSGDPSPTDYFIAKEKFKYPVLQISPEVIFANKVQLTDANFISNLKSKDHYRIRLDNDSVLETLRNIIAGWYVTLRTIAVVGLLSVLIYIGIRIIISSTGGEKAKYKQRLVDWIVAFCLLFIMHYVMAALVLVVDKVNLALSDAAGIEEGLELPPGYSVTYDRNVGKEWQEWMSDGMSAPSTSGSSSGGR